MCPAYRLAVAIHTRRTKDIEAKLLKSTVKVSSRHSMQLQQAKDSEKMFCDTVSDGIYYAVVMKARSESKGDGRDVRFLPHGSRASLFKCGRVLAGDFKDFAPSAWLAYEVLLSIHHDTKTLLIVLLGLAYCLESGCLRWRACMVFLLTPSTGGSQTKNALGK
eukprot:2586791-Amphidinium_carterae.1